VEEVGAPAKNLSFVVALEPQTLPQVQMPDARLQFRQRSLLFGGDFR
jgi:hypothetical protein